MKHFDIKSDINPETYMDEFTLIISEKNKPTQKIEMNTAELLDLEREVKHAIETNII